MSSRNTYRMKCELLRHQRSITSSENPHTSFTEVSSMKIIGVTFADDFKWHSIIVANLIQISSIRLFIFRSAIWWLLLFHHYFYTCIYTRSAWCTYEQTGTLPATYPSSYFLLVMQNVTVSFFHLWVRRWKSNCFWKLNYTHIIPCMTLYRTDISLPSSFLP